MAKDALIVITKDELAAVQRMCDTNKEFRSTVQRILRKVMQRARSRVSKDARAALGNDPRQAYRAVKHSVYKTIVGGSISILSKRKASNVRVSVQKDRKIDRNPHQRGGNRIKRSDDSRNRLDTYYGSDRGFILRFFNAGTGTRQSRWGSRGALRQRSFFGTSSTFQLNKAAEEFRQEIEKLVQDTYNKK